MSVASINGVTDSSKWNTGSGGSGGMGSILALSKGMGNFGEAQQYGGMASSLDADAGLLGIQADSLLAQSDYVTKRMEDKGKKTSGSQIAAYAKSGVTFSGSAMLVYAESEKNIRLDILTTRLNYAKEANRLGFNALNKRIAAGQARTRQVQKYGEGVMNMASSLAMTGA